MSTGELDMSEIMGIGGELPFESALTAWTALDWNEVLKQGNRLYDQVTEAVTMPTREQRLAALNQFDRELATIDSRRRQPSRLVRAGLSRRARAEIVSDAVSVGLLPALNAATRSGDRAEANLQLTRIAAALAVYRATNGSYPKKLNSLIPSVLNRLPLDLYSGQPFKYKPKQDGGYLLYSVFNNGVDDRGTDFKGQIVDGEYLPRNASGSLSLDTSDIVVRVPCRSFEYPWQSQAVNEEAGEKPGGEHSQD